MLRLLIDENVDHDILRGLIRRVPELDFVVVVEIGLAETADIDLLRWAASENRTMLTHDISTMTDYAKQLVTHQEPMAGMIVVPNRLGIGKAIEDLELSVQCQSESDMLDTIQYLPL
jgi:predicted nuclease of predicted toxin-antitoxin system